MAAPQTFQEALKLFKDNKGVVTRFANQIEERFSSIGESPPSKLDVTKLSDLVDKLEQKLDILIECQDVMKQLQPGDVPADMGTYLARAKEGSKRGNDFLRKWDGATASAMATARTLGYADVVKIDYGMRPEDPLSSNSQFSEFKAWMGSVQAFFQANKLDKQSREVQLNQLRGCLHSDLQLWLDGIVADHPDLLVIQKDGCLDKLQLYFEDKFKLIRRRFDYFTYKKTPGQSIEDFILKQEALAREAELDSIKVDDIRILCLISGVNDSQVRKELFKLPDGSTKEKFKETALLQESANVNEKHFSEPVKVGAMKKSAYRASKEQMLKSKFQHSKLNCYNCDGKGHIVRNCPKPKNQKKINAAFVAEYESLSSDEEEQACKMRSVRVARVCSSPTPKSVDNDSVSQNSDDYWVDKRKLKDRPESLVNGMKVNDEVKVINPGSNTVNCGRILLLKNKNQCFVQTVKGIRVYSHDRLVPDT